MAAKVNYRDKIKKIRREGLVRECPVDRQAISALMKRSSRDIDTAKRNLEIDEECAFTYAYNAMLHSAMALMFSEGYRAEAKNKHVTVIRFAEAFLGDEFKSLIAIYDHMRRKRHQLTYEPGVPCTRKETEDVLKSAEEFLRAISARIREKDPQIGLDFYG